MGSRMRMGRGIGAERGVRIGVRMRIMSGMGIGTEMEIWMRDWMVLRSQGYPETGRSLTVRENNACGDTSFVAEARESRLK